MTEAEWVACPDPMPMLEFLKGKASDRKLRLFAVACCRRGERHFIDPCQSKAVQAVERYADDRSAAKAMTDAEHAVRRFDAIYFDERAPGHEAAYRTACVVIQATADRPLERLCSRNSPHWLDDVVWGTASAAGYAAIKAEEGAGRHYDDWDYHVDLDRAIAAENVILAALFREVFGNPFRPVAADPSWLTSTTVALASGIYRDWAFDRLPVLADSLQDAGCENDGVLVHCRSEGLHVRGCWVIDLLLGKG
ncbi:MAG: hypothetical protein JWO38_1125 [Gemmataceae bacterium]|nr:hypothetical protein [Gemmataceae bacterium]